MPAFVRAGLLLGLLLGLLPTVALAQGLQLTVVDAVIGILGYSRWPGPVRPLQLCVSQGSTHATDLRALHEIAPAGRLVPVRLVPAEADPPIDCDAVFLGSGASVEAVLARLVGRPVLTIGDGAPFCSHGGMFCLVPRAGGGLRIEVNLDTVARSGLKVHPQVLRLGQPRAEGGGP